MGKPCTGVKVSKEVEDLLLWEDPIKSGGILGGATVAYLLFHCSGYTAMYIVCNLLLVGVVGTFVWSIIAQLLGKPEFPLLTLAYVACVGAFAGPKVYVLYKEDIDKYIGIAKVKVDEVVGQAKEFVNDKVLSKIKLPAKKTE